MIHLFDPSIQCIHSFIIHTIIDTVRTECITILDYKEKRMIYRFGPYSLPYIAFISASTPLPIFKCTCNFFFFSVSDSGMDIARIVYFHYSSNRTVIRSTVQINVYIRIHNDRLSDSKHVKVIAKIYLQMR